MTSTETKSPPLCPECGGSGYIGYDVPVGHPQFGKVVRCRNQAHVNRQAVKLSNLSQMHPDDLALRLSAIDSVPGNEEMLAACQKMLDNPRGWLYLWGGPGNAKSIALRAMCNELSDLGFYPVVYIKFSRLVEIVRQAQSAQFAKREHLKKNGNLDEWDNGYIDTLNWLLKIKALAIEEFDKARLTEFAQEFRFEFLDERYEQGVRGETVTMFASNSHPSEFTDSALVSRFTSGKFIIVENKAGDVRQSEQWQD